MTSREVLLFCIFAWIPMIKLQLTLNKAEEKQELDEFPPRPRALCRSVMDRALM